MLKMPFQTPDQSPEMNARTVEMTEQTTFIAVVTIASIWGNTASMIPRM